MPVLLFMDDLKPQRLTCKIGSFPVVLWISEKTVCSEIRMIKKGGLNNHQPNVKLLQNVFKFPFVYNKNIVFTIEYNSICC